MAKSIRDAYGEALVRYGKDDPRVVVLDADVAGSTKSGIFAAACPERFFNVGIAEANMTAMAAGFASSGKVPYVNTFAVFISTIGSIAARALACYSDLNIRLMGAYGGLSDAYDGPSHHATEDIAIMRALPNMTVLVPSDEAMTDWMVKESINYHGPMYIRLSRDAMPDCYEAGREFEIGKGVTVREGSDITVIACGIMVSKAKEAAEILEKEGVSVRVVDMYSIKPIDEELIVACAKETGAIVTAEEHNVIGGLGGAVCEVLGRNGCGVPVGMVGMQDCFSVTGSYADLFREFKLDAAGVAEKIRETLARK